jgi:transposase-like protein
MGQILHKRARTTAVMRAEIQNSSLSQYKLAAKYGINRKTVAKWQSREHVTDKAMGNGRYNSVLTSDEELVIKTTREKTLLPLDDLYDLLKPSIAKLSRSNLHRCLQHYGISRTSEALNPKRKIGKFKVYEIGYLHIDITDFWLQKKKYSLFVAIDRVSKLAIAEVYENKTMQSALDFLEYVFEFYPYKIHRILTDNGLQFTYRALPSNKRPKLKRHPFTKKCQEQGIKHKLTQFFSPQTNGQVERMNKTLKDATIKMFEYQSIEQFKVNIQDFLTYYNRSKKLSALKRLSPFDFLKNYSKIHSHLFHKNIDHLCSGLNI